MKKSKRKTQQLAKDYSFVTGTCGRVVSIMFCRRDVLLYIDAVCPYVVLSDASMPTVVCLSDNSE